MLLRPWRSPVLGGFVRSAWIFGRSANFVRAPGFAAVALFLVTPALFLFQPLLLHPAMLFGMQGALFLVALMLAPLALIPLGLLVVQRALPNAGPLLAANERPAVQFAFNVFDALGDAAHLVHQFAQLLPFFVMPIV